MLIKVRKTRVQPKIDIDPKTRVQPKIYIDPW
jgi:hypothetical protein